MASTNYILLVDTYSRLILLDLQSSVAPCHGQAVTKIYGTL